MTESSTIQKLFHGRRRGRTLSDLKKTYLDWLLNNFLFDPLHKEFVLSGNVNFQKSSIFQEQLLLFFQENKEIWIEIGFGGGENIDIFYSKLAPSSKIALIGVEVFLNGLYQLGKNLYNNPSFSLNSLSKSNPLKIFPFPIQNLWPYLPNCSMDGIILFFPDPWPKKSHHKRRLVNQDLIRTAFNVLRSSGLFVIATDDPSYQEWIKEHIVIAQKTLPFSLIYEENKRPFLDAFPHFQETQTKYEKKALKECRSPLYFILKKSV